VAGAGAVGPLVWLTGGTGSTGSGKTTLGAQLKITGAFPCYEGDCFMFHLNQYRDTRAAN
jgi:hypothetical protein